MAGYNNRSAYGDTQTHRCKRAQQGKGISLQARTLSLSQCTETYEISCQDCALRHDFLFRAANPSLTSSLFYESILADFSICHNTLLLSSHIRSEIICSEALS